MYDYTEVLRDYDSLIKLTKQAIEEMILYINGTIDYDIFVKRFSPIMVNVTKISFNLFGKLKSIFLISEERAEEWFFTASTLAIGTIRIISDLLAFLTSVSGFLKCIPEDLRKKFFNVAKDYIEGYLNFIYISHKEIEKLSQRQGR